MKIGSKDSNPKVVKVNSLGRIGVIFFVIGFITAALVLLVILKIQGGVVLSKDSYDYYKGLNKDYGKYYEMRTMIEEDALYSYEADDMDDEIASSIIAGLKDDEYAKYYSKEEYDQFKHRYSSYVGIGVAIQEVDGAIVINRVVTDGTAAEAGLKAGDKILEVDGKTPESLDDATELISGEAGTTVKIKAERDGKSKDYEIARAEIHDDSVVYQIYDKDKKIGYVRILAFSDGTSKQFKSAVKELKNKGCDKLIIDLRDNTGGKEDEGLKVADLLLPSCKIITEKDHGNKETVHKSGQSNIGIDYVLLVNENTASSSEIVASAVKANKAGKIIGTKTYGKGLIQKLHEFKDGSAFKYTVGEYVAADGSKVNRVGITPDIEATGDDALKAAVKSFE